MSESTIIAWTNRTFNVAWGCTKVSPGCKNCYADSLSERYGYKGVWGPSGSRRLFGAKHWAEPLKWEREAVRLGTRLRVFSSSMCDLFEEHELIAGELVKLWPLIRATPHLDWQLLTKRPERIMQSLPADWGNGYPNVWLGTSIENQDYAFRADHLREIPAVVRFISYEPALGPLRLDLTGIDWMIYGGESGAHFRPEDKQWARDARDDCGRYGTAFFHKQSAARFTERGIDLDGEIIREYPVPRAA